VCCVNRKKNENKLAKLALIAVAAGVLTLGSVQDASAAKTGGRIGGQAFKSSAPRSSPRINNSRYGLNHHCLFSLLSHKSTLFACASSFFQPFLFGSSYSYNCNKDEIHKDEIVSNSQAHIYVDEDPTSRL